ncbi:hypothetical protein CAPTEDRAFT_219208 [Capitella teleta]|uniref:RING-type domain-containing protein n=1 Tax=Capitella teleta TaxID=283909 RepID=R7U9M2_CAPTE|nr:hypothetical protein CAPTEDRAFT_219208 [Capitella teleta]|eukprot:ELU00498.1 hypothetical protein CAPTEDRAFT_219208 [Capitella teleta]
MDIMSTPELVVSDSIIALLLCLIFTVIFFVIKSHMNLDDVIDDDVRITTGIPQQVMGHVFNPLSLKILDPATASITDGIKLELTSKCASWVRVFWGVSIREVYPIIYAEWAEFCSSFSGDNFLEGISLKRDEFIFPEPVTGKILELQVDSEELDLGAPPRARYPLVVMVIDMDVLERPLEDVLTLQQIACVVHLFHVRDSHCSAESHAFAQYVRTPAGHPFNLKPLYVTQGDGDLSPQTQCVVCISTAVQRVIMPCRHACVCSECFGRLPRCPMCQGHITSFFPLNSS